MFETLKSVEGTDRVVNVLLTCGRWLNHVTIRSISSQTLDVDGDVPAGAVVFNAQQVQAVLVPKPEGF